SSVIAAQLRRCRSQIRPASPGPISPRSTPGPASSAAYLSASGRASPNTSAAPGGAAIDTESADPEPADCVSTDFTLTDDIARRPRPHRAVRLRATRLLVAGSAHREHNDPAGGLLALRLTA